MPWLVIEAVARLGRLKACERKDTPWMAWLKVSPVWVRIALLRSNASISVPSEPTSRPMRSKTWRFG